MYNPPMLHLGLIVYFLSLVSGIVLAAVLFYRYRLSGDRKVLVFLAFKLSYTAIIVLALVALYLEANLGAGGLRFLEGGILLLTVPMYWSFSSFLRLSRGLAPDRRETVVTAVFSLWTILWSVLYFLVPAGAFPFVAVGAVLVFFLALTFRSLLRHPGAKGGRAATRRELRVDALIVALAVALSLAEAMLVRVFTVERGFFFSMAAAYAVINARDWMKYAAPKAVARVDDLPEAFSERYRLTESERRVARALCAGRSNKAMAGEFGTAENTVKNQIYGLYRKTRVQSRVEFVNRVKEARLGSFADAVDDDDEARGDRPAR